MTPEQRAEEYWNKWINSPTHLMTNEEWRTNVGGLIARAIRLAQVEAIGGFVTSLCAAAGKNNPHLSWNDGMLEAIKMGKAKADAIQAEIDK